MTGTPNLALPLLAAAQAQKHVTHNEALLAIDALVQCAVIDKDLAMPPASPADGDRYIVAAGAVGAWAGQAASLAVAQDGLWTFHAPKPGFVVFAIDESLLYFYGGGGWVPLTSALAAIQDLGLLGIGTAADAANPFSAKLNSALWTARGSGEGGTGDLRYTLNKEAAGNVLSLLFQSGYSGRAEIGLVGSDDVGLKVSPDGSTWRTALTLGSADGRVSIGQGLRHGPSGAALSSPIFTPGGDGQVSVYRNDIARPQNPRSAVVAGVSGNVLTLTTADAGMFYSGFMTGVSYARMWNITKSPNQPAWIAAIPASDKLQVRDGADIAGWTAGDTVQIGDPTAVTPNRVIAIDLSPMLQSVVGGVFRQTGILFNTAIAATSVASSLLVTPSALGGSFVTAAANPDTANAWAGMAIVPCTVASPISNSNLVFVRENCTGSLGQTHLSSIAVFA